MVLTWHKRFKDGWNGNPMELVHCRTTKRDGKLINRLMSGIREHCRLTEREVGDMLGIGKSSVQRILSDPSMTSYIELQNLKDTAKSIDVCVYK